eukprot:g80359.t1
MPMRSPMLLSIYTGFVCRYKERANDPKLSTTCKGALLNFSQVGVLSGVTWQSSGRSADTQHTHRRAVPWRDLSFLPLFFSPQLFSQPAQPPRIYPLAAVR